MSNPYIGEIRMFGGSFAPAGWALCQGQLMPIAENDVLFQLIGTTYGGDGQETFALPDLQGRVPVHNGQSPGTSTYIIGEKTGVEAVTLTAQQIPIHAHSALCSDVAGNTGTPTDQVPAANATTSNLMYANVDPNQNMSNLMASVVGGSQPHENMLPFLTINFIISLFGIFPSQT